MTIATDDGGGSTSFKPFANSNQANDGEDDEKRWIFLYPFNLWVSLYNN